MALIDKASLLFVPSVVAQEKAFNILPSGNRAPDSTDQNSGYDQTRADFTFDRGTDHGATRIGSDGLIKKYRENLLLQSNQFDTTWTKQNVSVTSGQSGYDGSNDAWKLTPNTSNTYHRITNAVSGAANLVVTLSVYAKADGYNFLRVSENATTGDYATFNLSNGSVSNNTSLDAKIESVGDGWYRCSSTIIPAASHRFDMYVMESALVQQPWAGNGTSGVLIQNAQLESGMVSTDYLDSGATTGKAGVLIDLPRINYDANGENGSLLLEPSRQQLLQYSEYFGSYTPLSATITDNAATSPEGLVNAASFIETTASGRHRTQTNSFSVTSGNTYTLSIFAKIASGSRLLCLNADYLFNARAYFDLVNGDVEGTDSGSASIEDYGNGWYRCSITGTSSITGSSIAYFGLEDGASDNGYTGDGTSGHYWYGIQAEAGSYSTSYIPNHGTSGGVTRAADSCSVTGVSDILNDSEGTFFVEIQAQSDDSASKVLTIGDGTSANRIQVFYQSGTKITTNIISGSVSQVSEFTTTYDQTENAKVVIRYANNNAKFYLNGSEIASDTSVTTPTGLDRIVFNNGTGASLFSGFMKQLIYFDTALTDAECITLTTL